MVQNLPAKAGDPGFHPRAEKGVATPCRLLTGESQGQRKLAACSPRGPKEWGTSEQLTLHCMGDVYVPAYQTLC